VIDPETVRLNAAQMASPSYRLAALDQDFLLSDPMRGVRFMMEYAKAEEALRTWGVRSTIVVFGSARIGEDGEGQHSRWYGEARAFGGSPGPGRDDAGAGRVPVACRPIAPCPGFAAPAGSTWRKDMH
jgi:hypothetical protein